MTGKSPGFSFVFVLLQCLLTCGFTSDALGQAGHDSYEAGVAAFESGSYRQALRIFSASIDDGDTDSRLYYYRGLTNRRLGRHADAAFDFQRGSDHEARQGSLASSTFQHIKGSDRFVLEGYRHQIGLGSTLTRLKNRSPGEQLAQNDSGEQSNRTAEVPAGSPLSSLDPADPYSRPQGFFDDLGAPTEELFVRDSAPDAQEAEAEDVPNDATEEAADEPDIFAFQDDETNDDNSSFATEDDAADMTNEDFDLDSIEEPAQTADAQPSGEGGGRALRSIFRALGKAAPKVDFSQLQQQLPIPGAAMPETAAADGNPTGFDSPLPGQDTGARDAPPGIDTPPAFADEINQFGEDPAESPTNSGPDVGNPFVDDPL